MENKTWEDMKFCGILRDRETNEFISLSIPIKDFVEKEKMIELAEGWNKPSSDGIPSRTFYEISEDPLIVQIAIKQRMKDMKKQNGPMDDVDHNIDCIEDAINDLENARDALERIKRRDRDAR